MQLIDEHGVDVLQGLGANCDEAATTSVPIVYANTSIHPVVDEFSRLTLRVDQQFAASAEITITLYWALGY